MEKCYTFKGQRLEHGLSCLFQAIGNILLQRCRARMTKHRQQSTEVRAKGLDPIWSQVCSSLLHTYFVKEVRNASNPFYTPNTSG